MDLNQLQQALQSGNLTAAQTAYNAIVSLGQSGPFANGAPFGVASREQDFQAIGAALQAGDLAGAKQAFQTLEASFQPTPGSPVTNSSSSAGPDVVVKLSGNQ
jgi:outer membrane protein assembly factor BamD (BamD/ComL family)